MPQINDQQSKNTQKMTSKLFNRESQRKKSKIENDLFNFRVALIDNLIFSPKPNRFKRFENR
jgi:hypothetical protein